MKPHGRRGREVEKPLAGSYTLWVCFSDNSAFDFSSGLEDLTCLSSTTGFRMTKRSEVLLSLLPIPFGMCLPTLLAFWVHSHRLQRSWVEAAYAVASDFNQSIFESLAFPTAVYLPPFIVLATICFFSNTSGRRLLGLLALGLTLICSVQIPYTIRLFKRIPEGEAEFIWTAYIVLTGLTLAVLGFGMFVVWIYQSVKRKAERLTARTPTR
jgi:hypothetical protein